MRCSPCTDAGCTVVGEACCFQREETLENSAADNRTFPFLALGSWLEQLVGGCTGGSGLLVGVFVADCGGWFVEVNFCFSVNVTNILVSTRLRKFHLFQPKAITFCKPESTSTFAACIPI